jgi:hypothetical protein
MAPIDEGTMEDFPLSKRLELHALWVRTSGKEGVRLDLSRQSIRGLDTHDAVQRGAANIDPGLISPSRLS